MEKKRIILASGSPRRRELLGLVCPEFDVCPSAADETLTPGAPVADEVRRLAYEKAESVLRETQGPRAVIGSDTMVVLDGAPLGKPRDAADAARMLRLLSGRRHEVLTAVALCTDEGACDCALSRTQVEFYALTEEEIARYVATGEPLDKAGAYGIQGLGALLVRRIEGDFYGVMGLPVALLARMLRACGIL